MNNLEGRLVQCFETVFPGITSEALRNATMDTIEPWDSIAEVTLINIVEEEFRLQIDPELFPTLISFSSFKEYLHATGVS